MNFISFTGGVLIAVLMVGAMFILYSCLNSYQMRMMEQIRKIKNKVYDLEQKLDNQGESLAEVRQYLSKTEPGKTEMKKKHEGTAGGSSFTEQFERNGRIVTRQIDEIDNIACDHDCDNCPCQGVCRQEGGNDE